MSKFVQDIVVQQTCDTLVYRYLVEKGHLRTAKLLKEERKNSYTLTAKKDEKVSEIFSHLIPKYVQMELDSVSSNLVCDYMKKHENPKIQKLALKLKSMVPSIQITGKNTSIEEILNPAIVARKILVPVKKKQSNQLPNQAKRQNSSMKKVSGTDLKSKAPTKTLVSYSFGSEEKVSPLKDVFINRINDIEV